MDVCSHGRPDHIELTQQLAEAMYGHRLAARDKTPQQVFESLLDDIRKTYRRE